MKKLGSLLSAALVVFVGTYWAFDRGAKDFQVFYAAWSHVLSGHSSQMYALSPDRFLYAPGFAWLFSPFALLPYRVALLIWCFFKIGVVAFLVQELADVIRKASSPLSRHALSIAALGVLFCARPFLIDFQYGQVNILILGASSWAVLGHFKKVEPIWDFTRWAVLGVAAVAKIFPLPLLLVPLFLSAGVPPKKLRGERWGVFAGVGLILVIPFLFEGLQGGASLYFQWNQALFSRGMPIESHNQSFTAFLFHFASDLATPVIAQGRIYQFGHGLLSLETIKHLSLGWTLITSGFLLALLTVSSAQSQLRRVACLTSGLILPSHLVWKPYFVMTYPVAVLFLSDALEQNAKRSRFIFVLFTAAFINLTTFDLIGYEWAAALEAMSLLLWVHLFIMILVMGRTSSRVKL